MKMRRREEVSEEGGGNARPRRRPVSMTYMNLVSWRGASLLRETMTSESLISQRGSR